MEAGSKWWELVDSPVVVTTTSLAHHADKSADNVAALVNKRVPDLHRFVHELARIARRSVLLIANNRRVHYEGISGVDFGRIARGWIAKWYVGAEVPLPATISQIVGRLVPDPNHLFSLPHAEPLHACVIDVAYQRPTPIPQSLAVFIPTVGHPSFAETLRQTLHEQSWRDGDEVFIMNNGNRDDARRIAAEHLPRPNVFLLPIIPQQYGHVCCNQVVAMTLSEYAVHLNEGDILVPGALDTIRDIIRQENKHAFVFRGEYPNGERIWQYQRPNPGNTEMGCFVHRLDFSSYGHFEEQDAQFINATMRLNPGGVAWRDEVIIKLRPRDLA